MTATEKGLTRCAGCGMLIHVSHSDQCPTCDALSQHANPGLLTPG